MRTGSHEWLEWLAEFTPPSPNLDVLEDSSPHDQEVMLEQAVVALGALAASERGALWIAVCGHLYSDTDAYGGAREFLIEMWVPLVEDPVMGIRVKNILTEVMLRAEAEVVDLAGSGIHPNIVRGALESLSDARAELSSDATNDLPELVTTVVNLCGLTAHLVARHDPTVRSPAGVAAAMIADVPTNGDVWKQAAFMHADSPVFTAAILTGILQEYAHVPSTALDTLVFDALEDAPEELLLSATALNQLESCTTSVAVADAYAALVHQNPAQVVDVAEAHGWIPTMFAAILVATTVAAGAERDRWTVNQPGAADYLERWMGNWIVLNAA
jgi:hypothetical protein